MIYVLDELAAQELYALNTLKLPKVEGYCITSSFFTELDDLTWQLLHRELIFSPVHSTLRFKPLKSYDEDLKKFRHKLYWTTESTINFRLGYMLLFDIEILFVVNYDTLSWFIDYHYVPKYNLAVTRMYLIKNGLPLGLANTTNFIGEIK